MTRTSSNILCTSCDIHLPIKDFSKSQKKIKNRESAQCRSCETPHPSNDVKDDILCTSCLIPLPIDSFSNNQKKMKNRVSARCKNCILFFCSDLAFGKEGVDKDPVEKKKGCECKEYRAGMLKKEKREMGGRKKRGREDREDDGDEGPRKRTSNEEINSK
jgi:hypothetical protein